MKRFLQSRTARVLLALLCAAVLGVLLAATAAGGTSPVSRAVALAFTPLQKAASFLSSRLSDLNAGFVSADYYRGQLRQMQDEIDALRADLVDYEQTAQKLDEYEKMLGLKESNPDFKFAAGTVIARDAADRYGAFVLDCGSADGVAVDDPVLCGNYLVGVVKAVRVTSCTVETFLHPEISVSAYEVRSREEGYVSGDAALAGRGMCRLGGLAGDTAVSVGGIVCTSGIGGIYPRDLIVGTVREIKTETADISAYAVLEPGVDLSALTAAFVLTDFAGKGE